MAYRISQPLAATPLPGDGKKRKKKRVTRSKRVITSGIENRSGGGNRHSGSAVKNRGKYGTGGEGYILTEKVKTVRGKDGKIKKEVVKSKNKSLAGGRKDLIKSKDVTRYKKDGTRVTRYKTKGMGVKTKGKETFKGVKFVSEKRKRVAPSKKTFREDGTKKRAARHTTKTITGTRKSLTKTTRKQGPRKTRTKYSYKRQD